MKLRKILIEHIRLVFDLALIGVSILGSTLFFLLQTVFLLFSSTNGVYLSINILAGLWLLYVMLCKTKFDTQISLFLLAVISVSILSFIGKSQSDGIIKVAWIIPLLCFFTLLLFDISILLFTEKANNGAKIKLKVCQKGKDNRALYFLSAILCLNVSLTSPFRPLLSPSLFYGKRKIKFDPYFSHILHTLTLQIKNREPYPLSTGIHLPSLRLHSIYGHCLEPERIHIDGIAFFALQSGCDYYLDWHCSDPIRHQHRDRGVSQRTAQGKRGQTALILETTGQQRVRYR